MGFLRLSTAFSLAVSFEESPTPVAKCTDALDDSVLTG
jgi:hypothetical protein